MDSDSFFRNFGRNVAKRRRELEITQEALARRLDLSRPSVTNIERGEQGVSLYVALQIANALGFDDLNMLIPRETAIAPQNAEHVQILTPSGGMSDAARRQVERIWREVGKDAS